MLIKIHDLEERLLET
jgi:hypothetical protein